MSTFAHHRAALISRVLDGDGRSTAANRRAAFKHEEVPERLRSLVEKVAKHAYKVTDEDITEVKAAGFSEDEIFELTVCAAVGQANRQYEGALAVLDAATKE